MFPFFSQSKTNVFEDRRKKQEVWRAMRRAIDLRASQELLRVEDNRQFRRTAVSIPVLMKSTGVGVDSNPIFGITKNFSDDGMAILCSCEWATGQTVFCSIWGEKPICFLGTVRQSHPAGGGYWETGVAFQELTYLSEWESLRRLATSLKPDEE